MAGKSEPDRMMECVLNLSEGRRPRILEKAEATISRVSGVWLLDRSADVDHNRSVYTFVGRPESVSEAAFRVTALARDLIDLRRHRGVHPRMGAVDVVPFVPLQGTSPQECVASARRLGERIGAELKIPVYLYGEAATRTDRRELPGIRNVGFEELSRLIERDPGRRPDFGPDRLHPTAGAVAVGVRDFLIAFNVLLGTDDRLLASQIARCVRERDGGLPAVRALGMVLPGRGRAQISMNLLDFRRTGLREAFAKVGEEAVRLGVEVVESELVGLVPEEAWRGLSPKDLMLGDFDSERILENRIRSVTAGRPSEPLEERTASGGRSKKEASR